MAQGYTETHRDQNRAHQETKATMTGSKALTSMATGIVGAVAAGAVAGALTYDFSHDEQEAIQFSAVTGAAFATLTVTSASLKYVLDNLQTCLNSEFIKQGIVLSTQVLLAYAIISMIKMTVPPTEGLAGLELDAESMIPLLFAVLPTKAAVEALTKKLTDNRLISTLAGVIAEVGMIIGGTWSAKSLADFFGFKGLDKMPFAGYAFGAAAGVNGLVQAGAQATASCYHYACSFFSKQTNAEAENLAIAPAQDYEAINGDESGRNGYAPDNIHSA